MTLEVLGSSSDGNCYIFKPEKGKTLIIDCGVNFKKVKHAIDFDINSICGTLVTHSHGDHSKFIKDFLASKIDVYMSLETKKETSLSSYGIKIIEAKKKFQIGDFKVFPFEVKHDVNCLAFYINHPESGNFLFATDCFYVPNRFANLNNILIEANYRTDILKRNIAAGKIPTLLRDRTIESHMSFETCKEALLANDLSVVNNIVLIHLSAGNSNAKEFENDMFEATGKNIHIADVGMKINFNKTPF